MVGDSRPVPGGDATVLAAWNESARGEHPAGVLNQVIETAESRFRDHAMVPCRVAACPRPQHPSFVGRWAEASVWLFTTNTDGLPRSEAQRLGVSYPAQVRQGRWVVLCPCGSAQLASSTDHRFWCVECGNEYTGRMWVAVTWPDPPLVSAIEAALLLRPHRHNQNWLPHESVNDLQAENRDNHV